jgi:histidyl-tRNA synthetase
MAELGGQSLSGIGFGLGVDRALLAAEAEGVINVNAFVSDLFIIPLGDAAKEMAMKIAGLIWWQVWPLVAQLSPKKSLTRLRLWPQSARLTQPEFILRLTAVWLQRIDVLLDPLTARWI